MQAREIADPESNSVRSAFHMLVAKRILPHAHTLAGGVAVIAVPSAAGLRGEPVQALLKLNLKPLQRLFRLPTLQRVCDQLMFLPC